MIHIFNALSDDYDLIQTIDAHSTLVVDIKLVITSIGIKNKHKITQYEKQTEEKGTDIFYIQRSVMELTRSPMVCENTRRKTTEIHRVVQM